MLSQGVAGTAQRCSGTGAALDLAHSRYPAALEAYSVVPFGVELEQHELLVWRPVGCRLG